MPPIEFINPLTLAGFLLLIPLIILYLLKPKPKNVKISSIMFIMRIEKSRRFSSFLKRFVQDPFLIIQIFIISLLVLAIASPFLIAKEEQSTRESIVVVIDASASMQSKDVYPDRFSKSLEIAKEILKGINDKSIISIVLAENIPIVALRDGNRKDAEDVLNAINAADTPSNIGDSILFAKDMLSGSGLGKKIYVLSDLSLGSGTDIDIAERIASSENISVKFVKISGNGRNIGIIGINAKRFLTDRNKFYLTFNVKNFNENEEEVVADVLIDGILFNSMKKKIPPNSGELFTLQGEVSDDEHAITVQLKNSDDFGVDNTVFAVIPLIKKYKVLLITNEDSDAYLKYALESSKDIELGRALIPIIPKIGEFDTVILGNIKKELILPGTFKDIEEYVKNGGNFIIISSSDLNQLNDPYLNAMVPVKLGELKNTESEIYVESESEILTDVVPKGSEKFPNIITKKHINSFPKQDSTVIAKIGDSPAIAFRKHGPGRVVYININPNPEWSNFYYSSSFPIFWLQLVKWINREDNIGITNLHSGDYLPASGTSANITTPSGRVLTQGNIIFDETGLYSINYGKKFGRISVNLVNERESDIASSGASVGIINDEKFNIKKELFDVKKELFLYMLILALLFIVIEIVYSRKRGLI